MSTHSLTAEQRFEAGHLRLLRWSFLVAAVIHLAIALTLPSPHFQPYRLSEQTTMRLVDAPPAIVVPPPPEEIDKPRTVTEIVPSDDAGAEATMPSTALDPVAPFDPPAAPDRHPGFFDSFDTPPEVIERVRPVYPEMARQAELEGVVVLKAGIDESGRVREALVLQSVPGLDQAALDAIYQWRFRPATQRDVPVPVGFTVPVRFTLRD